MSKTPDITAPLPPRLTGKRRVRYSMLANWYGSERADVEISAHTCQPKVIGTLLDEELTRIRRPENGVLLKLRGEWGKVVGSMFAKFTEAESLKDGILTLKVRHSALLVELKPSCDLIAKRVNEVVGENTCKEVRLRV